MVVAGGGGGGAGYTPCTDGAGGGGAGGYRASGYGPAPLQGTALFFPQSGTYNVTVGAGGAGGSPACTPGQQGADGNDSIFNVCNLL